MTKREYKYLIKPKRNKKIAALEVFYGGINYGKSAASRKFARLLWPSGIEPERIGP